LRYHFLSRRLPVRARPVRSRREIRAEGHASAGIPIRPRWYTGACSGHDEPELDPVSSLPGSAQDLTWTAILPKDGTVPVSAVGPTFWWGGAVSDPNPHALFGQAFLELQFYPDSVVKTCSSDGGFNVTQAPNEYTVCSPVWQVSTQSGAEDAAFNAELYDGSTNSPLIMHGATPSRFTSSTPLRAWAGTSR
jgi:hypothetical protein